VEVEVEVEVGMGEVDPFGIVRGQRRQMIYSRASAAAAVVGAVRVEGRGGGLKRDGPRWLAGGPEWAAAVAAWAGVVGVCLNALPVVVAP
jgi:hypothetical protein